MDVINAIAPEHPIPISHNTSLGCENTGRRDWPVSEFAPDSHYIGANGGGIIIRLTGLLTKPLTVARQAAHLEAQVIGQEAQLKWLQR